MKFLHTHSKLVLPQGVPRQKPIRTRGAAKNAVTAHIHERRQIIEHLGPDMFLGLNSSLTAEQLGVGGKYRTGVRENIRRANVRIHLQKSNMVGEELARFIASRPKAVKHILTEGKIEERKFRTGLTKLKRELESRFGFKKNAASKVVEAVRQYLSVLSPHAHSSLSRNESAIKNIPMMHPAISKAHPNIHLFNGPRAKLSPLIKKRLAKKLVMVMENVYPNKTKEKLAEIKKALEITDKKMFADAIDAIDYALTQI